MFSPRRMKGCPSESTTVAVLAPTFQLLGGRASTGEQGKANKLPKLPYPRQNKHGEESSFQPNRVTTGVTFPIGFVV